MKISFAPSGAVSDCLIIMLSKKGLPKKAPSSLLRLTKELKKTFKAEKNTCLFVPHVKVGKAPSLLLAGMGDSEKIETESFRQMAGTLLKEMEKHSVSSATVDLSVVPVSNLPLSSLVTALTEGFYLAHYHFNELKTVKKNKSAIKNIFFTGLKADQNLKKALSSAQIVADSVNFARRLADMPSNLMTPAILAESVQKKFLELKDMKVTVWNKNHIKREQMGGVLGVAQGSAQEPRVIIMEYKGQAHSQKNTRPLCFVGKGLTFDSGGISIKPSKNMDEMKFDMCGSTAVIGALLAVARFKIKSECDRLGGFCRKHARWPCY